MTAARHIAFHVGLPPAALPVPGPLAGTYPQRSDLLAAWRRPWAAVQLARFQHRARARGVASVPHVLCAAVRAQQAVWCALGAAEFVPRLHDLRARLARSGFDGALRVEALGCVAATMQHTLGRDPFDSQIVCAGILLDDDLAEMATGEGKTLAVALAAAVAALAGVPVHVMTANDYLVARDAAALRPLFDALGLRTGHVLATSDPGSRHVAYAANVTWCTAREVAFDHLRDRLLLAGRGSELQQRATALAGVEAPPLLLRGLCMALVDEADSLLVDEATMPLVLAEAFDDPAHRAACFQALALARQLEPGRDVQIEGASHAVHWSAEGQDRLDTLAAGLSGRWLNRRHRQDLTAAALVALHALERDRHYLVRDGRIELLDAVTGRSAQGRVWQRGLQTLVELKEQCSVSPATRTTAQTSFQRFFARYLRLAGTSGTLAECRAELAAVYGKAVRRVALRRPCLRRTGPVRLFADAAARTRAVVARLQSLGDTGRPVLVGVDSVTAAQTLSQALAAAGIVHRVLDARHDADEAAIVARAGQRGAVTVATAMAGRGTDIELGPGVAALGGLHVICCQDNASARLDRQFVGRAARQGDPGSAETWHALDAPRWQGSAISDWCRIGRKADDEGAPGVPGAFVQFWSTARQHNSERQGMRQRRRLLEQDLRWQSRLDFTTLRA